MNITNSSLASPFRLVEIARDAATQAGNSNSLKGVLSRNKKTLAVAATVLLLGSAGAYIYRNHRAEVAGLAQRIWAPVRAGFGRVGALFNRGGAGEEAPPANDLEAANERIQALTKRVRELEGKMLSDEERERLRNLDREHGEGKCVSAADHAPDRCVSRSEHGADRCIPLYGKGGHYDTIREEKERWNRERS